MLVSDITTIDISFNHSIHSLSHDQMLLSLDNHFSIISHHFIRKHNFFERHVFKGATFSWNNEGSTDQVDSPLQLGSAQSLWSLSLACLRSMWATMRPRQAQIFVLSRILGHVSPWLLRIWKGACAIPGLVLSTETSNSAGRRCATKKSPNLFDSPKN